MKGRNATQRRKHRCATCQHTQYVHWTARARRAPPRCGACGAMALEPVTQAGRDDLRQEASHRTTPPSAVGVGVPSVEVLEQIDQGLASRLAATRRRAVAAMLEFGLPFDLVVPRVLRCLGDDDAAVRRAAQAFLAAERDRVTPSDALQRALGDPDPIVRAAAGAWLAASSGESR